MPSHKLQPSYHNHFICRDAFMMTLCLSCLLYYQLPLYFLYSHRPIRPPCHKSSQVPRCDPPLEARPAQKQLEPTLPASHYQQFPEPLRILLLHESSASSTAWQIVAVRTILQSAQSLLWSLPFLLLHSLWR